MKLNIKINRMNTLRIFAFIIVLTGLFSLNVKAQNQPAQAKSEATIVLTYYKKSDLAKTAIATVKAKNSEGKFVAAKSAWVNFYVMNNKELKLLKQAATNSKGQAVIALSKDLPLDDSMALTIVAKIENDKMYEDAQEQMHYKDAGIVLNLNSKDTARTVVAKVTQAGKDGKEVPVKGVDVKFYVQRLFGTMPALEENSVATEEDGTATFTFPKNIPGDKEGNYTVVAKIEDNDKFGNVEKQAGTSWGKALVLEKDPFPRALWEPYAPMPLVITISTLFGGVWFTYFFIFFQLRKIKTESEI